MDEELKKQQEFYDRGWRSELEAGKEQRGNLQTNLDFLSQTNLLKPNDRILEIGCGVVVDSTFASQVRVVDIEARDAVAPPRAGGVDVRVFVDRQGQVHLGGRISPSHEIGNPVVSVDDHRPTGLGHGVWFY